jgi:hypothetical protein
LPAGSWKAKPPPWLPPIRPEATCGGYSPAKRKNAVVLLARQEPGGATIAVFGG